MAQELQVNLDNMFPGFLYQNSTGNWSVGMHISSIYVDYLNGGRTTAVLIVGNVACSNEAEHIIAMTEART